MPVGTFPRSNIPAIFAQTGLLNRNGTSTAIDRTSDNMLWMITRSGGLIRPQARSPRQLSPLLLPVGVCPQRD
jgi:hypothetical protein